MTRLSKESKQTLATKIQALAIGVNAGEILIHDDGQTVETNTVKIERQTWPDDMRFTFTISVKQEKDTAFTEVTDCLVNAWNGVEDGTIECSVMLFFQQCHTKLHNFITKGQEEARKELKLDLIANL